MPALRKLAASARSSIHPSLPAAWSDEQYRIAGIWLLDTHFAQLTPQPLSRYLRRAITSPVDLARLTLAAYTPSQLSETTSRLPATTHPQSRTRDILNLLDEATHAAPLAGLPIPDAIALVQSRCGHTIAYGGLLQLLYRHYTAHHLRISRGHVKLRSDVIVHRIGADRKRDQLARHRVNRIVAATTPNLLIMRHRTSQLGRRD